MTKKPLPHPHFRTVTYVVTFHCRKLKIQRRNTVKLIYKGHSREAKNVSFISSCPLYTGYNYMHQSLMGIMRLSFIDSDLLNRGVLYRQ